MIRSFSLATVILSLAIGASVPALGDTAPPPQKEPAVTRHLKKHVKHHVKRWSAPPGYRSPEQIEREDYKAWRRDRAFARRYTVPQVYYFYYGAPFYTGRLGANRRDSLHAGPCWTQTPIGAVWNCGR